MDQCIINLSKLNLSLQKKDIFCGLFFLQEKEVTKTINELFKNRALLAVTGVVALMVGIALVLVHSIWEPNYKGLITLICYLSILKGVIRIGYPEKAKAFKDKILTGSNLTVIMTIFFLIGCYLTYIGFQLG